VLANDRSTGKRLSTCGCILSLTAERVGAIVSSGHQCNHYIEERCGALLRWAGEVPVPHESSYLRIPLLPKRVLPASDPRIARRQERGVSSSVLLRHCSWAPEIPAIYFFFEFLQCESEYLFSCF